MNEQILRQVLRLWASLTVKIPHMYFTLCSVRLPSKRGKQFRHVLLYICLHNVCGNPALLTHIDNNSNLTTRFIQFIFLAVSAQKLPNRGSVRRRFSKASSSGSKNYEMDCIGYGKRIEIATGLDSKIDYRA